MNAAVVIWALWVTGGGPSYGGSQWIPDPKAYFLSAEACEKVRVRINSRFAPECIPGEYIAPPRQPEKPTQKQKTLL